MLFAVDVRLIVGPLRSSSIRLAAASPATSALLGGFTSDGAVDELEKDVLGTVKPKGGTATCLRSTVSPLSSTGTITEYVPVMSGTMSAVSRHVRSSVVQRLSCPLARTKTRHLERSRC